MTAHKPPCPGPDAHTTKDGHPSCTGHANRQERRGLPCLNPPLKGATVCRHHGGKAPQVQAAAKRRRDEAAANRELDRLGATRRDIHPAEALIELVQFTAGEVDFWRRKVADLEEDQLTWGLTRSKTGGDDRGDTYEAGVPVAYKMLEASSNRLAAYAAAALKAGVDERRVRLAESQGQLVAQAIRQVLDQLHLTSEQLELVPTVVPAALRLIAGQVA